MHIYMAAQYNRKDHLHQKAKEEGYRSRAAYKLLELQRDHNLLRRGDTVLDLGCWPGGWLQVAAAGVGPNGKVVGIDLVAVDPLPETNITLLTGDARDEKMFEQLMAMAPQGYNAVISDMAPKLTGIKEADQAGCVACAELALFIAQKVLRPQGHLVMKVFKGNDTELFIRGLKPQFSKIVRTELDSTRATSNEFYVLALGKK